MGAPIPVFEALAKSFPSHEFLIESDEFSNHLHFSGIGKSGELTITKGLCVQLPLVTQHPASPSYVLSISTIVRRQPRFRSR